MHKVENELYETAYELGMTVGRQAEQTLQKRRELLKKRKDFENKKKNAEV